MSTIAQAYGAMQAFKAVMAALVFIAAGAVFITDPSGEVQAVVPEHRLVGMALLGFGLLFMVTLMAKGEVRYRLTSLLLILLAAGVVAGLSMLFWPQVRDAQSLAKEGKICTATVIRASSILPNKSKRFPTAVKFEAGTADVMLQARVQAGQRIEIRYLPDRPKVAIPTAAGSDWWSILNWRHTKSGFYILVGVVAFALLSLPFNLTNLIRGSRHSVTSNSKAA
jgi:hypothetical protein